MSDLEYGLQLPNGDVHWGSYLNRPINTEAERSVMALVLHKTAEECGFDEDEFVGRYQWVRRTVEVDPKKWVIDHPDIAPSLDPPAQNGQPVVEVPEVKAPRRRTKASAN